MNNNFIFHTSHCGSTFLSSLLSDSIETFTEPDWTKKIHTYQDPKEYLEMNLNNYTNCLIKFPSLYCYVSPLLEGKKVFLYRNLKNHLLKIFSSPYYIQLYLNLYYPVFEEKNNFKIINDSLMKKHAYMWVCRILSMDSEDSDTLWVETNDFLINTEKNIFSICKHFNLNYVNLHDNLNYHAKIVGLNHSNNKIDTKNVEITEKSFYKKEFGIIPNSMCFYDEEIMKCVNWVKNNFEIKEKLL